MRRRRLVLGALFALAAAVVLWRHEDAPPPAPPPPSVPAAPDTSIALPDLNNPAIVPEKKIRRVHELLQAWSMTMKSRSRVPLSSNAEITRSLTGHNILRVVFLPPNHPSISAAGELLDPWQTPYFFHALAADSWEIASAGPDRIRFNEDDLVFPPNRSPNSLRPGAR